MLGATIVGLMANSAAAESKKPAKDNGVRCALPGDTVERSQGTDYEFFMPGEWVAARHPSGDVKTLEYQADGTWKEVKAFTPAATRTVTSRPLPSLQQVP